MTKFTFDQMELLCQTPARVLTDALPQGVAAEIRASMAHFLVDGTEICSAGYNPTTYEPVVEVAAGRFNNDLLEGVALKLVADALSAAQEHELASAPEDDPHARAARILRGMAEDPAFAPGRGEIPSLA